MHGLGNVAYGQSIGMNDRIAAGEVVLDEFVEMAVEHLLRHASPGLEVEFRLIQPAAEPLTVLGNESGHQPADDDGGYQDQSIQQAT